MDRKMSLGVLVACTGLAACLHTESEAVVPSIIVPIGGELDAAPPFGAGLEVTVPILSSDLVNGTSSGVATITFHADETFTIDLPGAATITVADADLAFPPEFDATLNTTKATYWVGADDQVEVLLGEDAVGSDLFILARYEDLSGAEPSPVSFMVFGDETATLPTGTATYTGGFLSDVFDTTTGAPDALVPQLSGTSLIAADFGGNRVDVTLTVVGEGAGVVFSGSDLAVTGAQYGGIMTGAGPGTDYAGNFNGAFFGPNAEATAGTFNAEDITAATEIVGGFTGFQ